MIQVSDRDNSGECVMTFDMADENNFNEGELDVFLVNFYILHTSNIEYSFFIRVWTLANALNTTSPMAK